MEFHYNKLTPAEHERIAILFEECGECIHIIGKIMRHGYESVDPTKTNSPTNRTLLEKELGDVKAAMERMINNLDVSEKRIEARAKKKLSGQEYLHHNPYREI